MKEAVSIALFLVIILLIAGQIFVVPGAANDGGLSAAFGDLSEYGQFMVLAAALTFFYFYFQKS